MSAANLQLIEVAAKARAAGLTDADDLAQGHGFAAQELELIEALATAEPDNAYAIAAREHPEVLAIKLDIAARLVGMRLTTMERFKAACLAEREDADDLAAVIEAQARDYGAPAPRRTAVLLPGDGGGVLPSLHRPAPIHTATAEPAGASGACMVGRHRLGPLNHFGHATCGDCGVVVVAAAPGGPIDMKAGDYVGPKPF